MPEFDYLRRYDRMAVRAAHKVISSYSTSFSLATGLLSPSVRRDIRNLYAMVRIADEIVDGTVEAAGVSHTECEQLLDDYEAAVLAAPQHRFHVDPVLHAYAQTARRCDFDPAHVRAFFSSMRRDLNQSSHDQGSFEDYVYGSAEVIGLLCLQAFLVDHPVSDAERARLEAGARSLGSAFQKVNFLRDLHEDASVLGRSYFPGVDITSLTEGDKARLVAEIRSELIDARSVIPLLPPTARAGVLAATNLFAELNERIDATPAAELLTRRISVPRRTKAAILAKAVARSSRMKEGRS
ncbi:MAG: phytoene/squalene synthase family protein [Corynebacterium sp.]|uniref:phytoene/squalene synthase family protein n=1 Tax=Corynebacterium sp. TaxID=1720 RepID=UPI0026DF66E9|nr:phytoene/squalene synthase family protein [Corynebacterium sp.]MDO5669404.1 phytoene/squalene synthase family protein [Corynebacterium sp.]